VLQWASGTRFVSNAQHMFPIARRTSIVNMSQQSIKIGALNKFV